MQEVDVEGRHINLDSTRFFIRPHVEVTCVSERKSQTILSNSKYVNESLTCLDGPRVMRGHRQDHL